MMGSSGQTGATGPTGTKGDPGSTGAPGVSGIPGKLHKHLLKINMKAVVAGQKKLNFEGYLVINC